MNKNQSKRQRDMKAKLMAAICMLLVSSIMMVSTTYAWFTLSTAPEVTGLSTAVGANGNLEMALMPLSGDVTKINSGTSDSMASQAVNLANVTWGNLVDLSENTHYGLNDITLFPAKLNLDANGNIAANPLAVPVYGSDGRVSSLATNKTTTGVYTVGKFYEKAADGTANPKGVRAVGTISGMTERQLDYRAALAAASTAASGAQKTASDALKAEGPNLAAIAIEHATSTSESYTKADVKSLLNMVNALAGTADTTGALTMIENSIRQYLLAADASQNEDYDENEDYILKTDLATLNTEGYVPDGMKTMVTALATSLSNAKTAQTNLQALYADTTKDSYSWAEIEPSLELLANPSKMKINGIEVTNLKGYVQDDQGNKIQSGTDDDGNPIYQTNMDKLLSSALTQGLNLTLATDAGTFADIADFTGDYTATITIPNVSYGSFNVTNVPATMSTASTVSPSYLDQANTCVRNLGEPTGSGGKEMPISDYYGYIIDLAFRTNAADSYLKLQTEAVDRVYSDNTANDATMGGGATMSFKTVSTTFLPNSMLNLMKCIKIVFFDPSDGNKILGYATLDTDKATTAADGTISAGLVMCDANGTAKTGDDAAKIVDLEQNKAQQVSVLVYLDGENVTNADVAFDAAKSMSGTLNLQFSSSAKLVPMEYTDLRQGTGETTPSTPTAITLNATTDISGASVISAAYSSGKVVVGLTGVAEGTSVKVTVGTEELTTTTITQDSVVVAVVSPTSEVTSSTTVTVSAAN